MNSQSVPHGNAPVDEACAFLAEYLPCIKDDMQRLAAFSRQADYHAETLWNDPLFRSRVAALQARVDALDHSFARATQGSGDLVLLARIAATDIGREMSDLIVAAVGPYGLAQDPALHGGVATDELPGQIEAPGAPQFSALQNPASLCDNINDDLRTIIAEANPQMSGTQVTLGLSQEDEKLRADIDRFTAACAMPKTPDAPAAKPDNWQQFAAMGWLGAGIPEEAGGRGGSLSEMMIVAERLGAGLAVEPYAGCIVYTSQLLQTLLDAPVAARLLAPVVAGTMLLAMACHEAPARGGLRWTKTMATPDKGGFILDGCKVAIDGGGAATAYLVSARTAGEVYDPFGHSLFLVPRDTPGLKVRAWQMIDGSDMAIVELEGVHVPGEALLGKPGAALPALSAGMDAAIVANAFSALGAMEGLFTATTEQAQASGLPRQCCVDMLVAIEQARSAALLGLASLSQPDARRRAYLTSVTKVIIVRASELVCRQAIQLHGGMRATENLQIGDLCKSVAAVNSLRGSLDFHVSRIAMLM
jgi:alkylation response protein AidB-like acyl-CoA dehydrogenase